MAAIRLWAVGFRLWAWALATLALSFSATLAAQVGVPQPPRAGLTVSVRGDDGRPVAGAAVSVRTGATAPVAAATSADGIARIGDLAPGEYAVQVTAGGYNDASANATITAGQLAAVDVTLTRSAAAPAIDNQLPRPPGVATPDAEPSATPPLPADAPRARSTDVEQPGLAPDEHVFVPMPDRWNISMPDWDRYGERGDYPYVSSRWWDAYNPNRL
jgi:hypothetical protein